MSYASVKGRVQRPSESVSIRPAPRELSADEQKRVAEIRAAVVEHIPEAVDFVKAMYADGLIDGWRSVVRVTLLDGDGHE